MRGESFDVMRTSNISQQTRVCQNTIRQGQVSAINPNSVGVNSLRKTTHEPKHLCVVTRGICIVQNVNQSSEISKYLRSVTKILSKETPCWTCAHCHQYNRLPTSDFTNYSNFSISLPSQALRHCRLAKVDPILGDYHLWHFCAMLLVIHKMVNHDLYLASSEMETHTSNKVIRKKQQFDHRSANAQDASTARANEESSTSRR